MDPLRSYLGRLLLEEITPVVMVLTTPLAETACRKSGLSFVDMLAPFSLFKKIDVPVRTASEVPYRLQMFKIRMVYASDVRKEDYEVADERIKPVVSEANEKALPDLLSNPPQLEDVLGKPEADLCPLWIKKFNRELMQTLSYSEHETFDHPVACLLVVSSMDKEPISKFVDLFNTHQLPSLLNEGIMDPQILKHYLVLHDQQDGPQDIAVNVLAEMRSTLGLNDCKLLCINSSTEADGSNTENSWLPYKALGLDNHEGTCFLSMDDLNEMKDFMQDFASNHIIPYMEQKIRVLNQQVATTRKGFRNQIKNLWWRKRDDVPEAPNGPMYTFTSIESQIRVLGDFAFMLRDYELALSNYRLLATDYKLDKAWKRFAGVQEMSGLCYFMLDQSRKDAEYCMENAFSTYLRIGASGQRNATRCGLWWAEMLKTRGQYREASSVYFRVSNEEPSLHSAVLLEQAAFCYLLSSPPMLRKYGFHLILAGNSYYMSDQKQHAVRVYRNALFVYKQNPWSYINDHVHFNIGRWYGVLGILDVAIKHLLEVIACSHQSLVTQNMFLNDFFHYVQSMGKTFDVYKLQLPVFNMSSLRVIHEDHRTYASDADVVVSESTWQDLEEELIPSSSVVRTNWLDSQPKSSLRKFKDFSVCVAGEAVKVSVELKNPLHIPVDVSGISLICQLSTNLDALTSDVNGLTLDGGKDKVNTEPSVSIFETDEENFVVSKLDIILGGGESKRVQLDVTPKVEGILKLVGIRWTLSNSVVGYQYFEFDAQKKNKKGKRGRRRSLNSSLVVIKGLPKLAGSIDRMPTKSFAGDLQLLKLNLRNHSEYAVKGLKMKISNPRFVIPGDSSDMGLKFPHCLKKHTQSETKTVPYNSTKENLKGLLFAFPQDIEIQAGETLLWPIWFHAATPGNVSLYISLYYEMESSSDIKYRTLRMHYNLEVLPSLDISFAISMSSSRLQEYIVRMDVMNKTPSESFVLHQLSCVGSKWAVSALPSCSSISNVETVSANQAVTCFFKIKDFEADSCNEADRGSYRSDMALYPGSSGDVFDIAQSPLADFHFQERYRQGKLLKGPGSLLDFVLISKAADNSSDPSPDFQLLSHHTCHCSALSLSPAVRRFGDSHPVSHPRRPTSTKSSRASRSPPPTMAGDWQELGQAAAIGLVFAFLVAKLISTVIAFKEDNLRITRCSPPASPTAASRSPPPRPDTPAPAAPPQPSRGGDGDVSSDSDWEGVESTELDEEFSAASAFVAASAASGASVPEEAQLRLYGLYKIATEGPCTAPQPSALKLKARAKWNAWHKLGAMPTEEAMQEYITIVQELFPDWDTGSGMKRKDDDSTAPASGSKGPMGPVFSSLMYEEDEGNESELGDIHVSAREGATDDILKHLAAGVDVNVRDTEGRTPLHWAVDRGNLSAVEVLAKANADLNAKDNDGQTALHYAVVCEREDIAELLVKHHADLQIKDEDGNTARELCPSSWSFMNQAN